MNIVKNNSLLLLLSIFCLNSVNAMEDNNKRKLDEISDHNDDQTNKKQKQLTDDEKLALICKAIKSNNTPKIEMLIDNGINLNFKDKNDLSALRAAILLNKPHIAQLLVEQGANVNLKTNDGDTPLLCAIRKENLNITTFLIKNGANVNLSNNRGFTPLITALINHNFDLITLLIENNANFENCDNSDKLMILIKMIYKNNFDEFKILTNNTAYIDIIDKFKDKFLVLAACKNNLDFVELFIKKGANIDLKTSDCCSLLLWAIRNDRVDLAQLLIQSGANLNLQDGTYGVMEIYEPMEEGGMCQIIGMLDGTTRAGHGTKVSLVPKQKGKFHTPLMAAVKKGNFTLAKLLIEKGAYLDIQDTYDQTALYLSARKGNLDIAQLLIKNNANPNLMGYDCTSLHIAIYKNNFDIAQFLIETGTKLDIKTENDDEADPLFQCVRKYLDTDSESDLDEDCKKTIKTLLSHDAQFTVSDEVYVETAQNQPLKKMFDEIIAYKNAHSDQDKTTLDSAIKNNSAFNKYELLTLAALNNHARQIHYCIDQKTFTSLEVLEGLALRKHMPIEVITGNLVIKTDSGERKKLIKLAEEYDNKKFLKQFCHISRIYKTLDLFGRKQRIIKETIPNEIVRKIASYL